MVPSWIMKQRQDDHCSDQVATQGVWICRPPCWLICCNRGSSQEFVTWTFDHRPCAAARGCSSAAAILQTQLARDHQPGWPQIPQALMSSSWGQPCVVIKGQVAANVPCGLQQQQPSAPAASLPLPPPWSTSFPSRPPCPCKPQHQLSNHCKLASLPPAPHWSAARLLPAFPLCKAQHQLLLMCGPFSSQSFDEQTMHASKVNSTVSKYPSSFSQGP